MLVLAHAPFSMCPIMPNLSLAGSSQCSAPGLSDDTYAASVSVCKGFMVIQGLKIWFLILRLLQIPLHTFLLVTK